MQAFFEPKKSQNPAIERILSMTLESGERCRGQRSVMKPVVLDVLGSEPKK